MWIAKILSFITFWIILLAVALFYERYLPKSLSGTGYILSLITVMTFGASLDHELRNRRGPT